MKRSHEIDTMHTTQSAKAVVRNPATPQTVEQQIERQMRKHGYRNRLSEIIGKWPGDEDFDQLLKMLTK